jgi:hypothetical protein
VIEFVQTTLTYVQAKTKEAQQGNPPMKILLCMCMCCLYCFNKCIKYLSFNTYIMVAIDGESFCHCAWTSFKMLLTNAFRVEAAQGLSKILGWLAVLFIASSTTFLAAFSFANLPMFQLGSLDHSTDPPQWIDNHGPYAIQSSVLPSIAVFILSMLVALSFTQVLL